MKNYAQNNFQSKTSLARYYFYNLFLLQIQGVYFRFKYLHAVVTFYTYLLGISSDEMVIMVWNVNIMFLQYLF